MALQIDMEQTQKLTIDGVDFYYKKRSATRVRRLLLKTSTTGKIADVLGAVSYGDNLELMVMMASEFMTGWEGLTFTHTNEPVPFSIDYISVLPDEVLAEFCTKVVIPQIQEGLQSLSKEGRERKN